MLPSAICGPPSLKATPVWFLICKRQQFNILHVFYSLPCLAGQSQTHLQYLAEQLCGFPLLLFGCNDILVVASALGK